VAVQSNTCPNVIRGDTLTLRPAVRQQHGNHRCLESTCILQGLRTCRERRGTRQAARRPLTDAAAGAAGARPLPQLPVPLLLLPPLLLPAAVQPPRLSVLPRSKSSAALTADVSVGPSGASVASCRAEPAGAARQGKARPPRRRINTSAR
jgi:hypothetical protein